MTKQLPSALPEQPQNLSDALLEAQKLIDHVVPDGKNSHFKSKYATYEAVVSAIKPALNACGVMVMQKTHQPPEGRHGIVVETIFMGYGEQISAGELYVEAQAPTPHGYGSALTYAKRYALATACCLPNGEDDDGNKAEVETRQKVISKKAAPAVQADGKYVLYSGTTPLAAYDTPEALYQGCREHMKAPKDMNCIAIFDKSQKTIEQAIQDAPDAESAKQLQGVLTAFGVRNDS